jgi:hypothetical protein
MGALARLRGDHPAPHQDTVNGGNRGNDLTAPRQVVGNGLAESVNLFEAPVSGIY